MDPFAELSALLRREQLLLELLVFKLTELGHLLAQGDARFLGWAAEEVERAVEAVRLCELDRAVHVHTAALGLGRPAADEATLLARLAETAPEPWASQLTEHRRALTGLAEEVALGLRTTRRLAEAGSTALTSMFERVGDPLTKPPALLTYGPGSTDAWSDPIPRHRATL